MKIRIIFLLGALSLWVSSSSYAVETTPSQSSVKSGTDASQLMGLQKKSCADLKTTWQSLSTLSDYYDSRADETDGDKQDAWCDKYDAVSDTLASIETYFDANCSGALDSSESSSGAKMAGIPVCDMLELDKATAD